jgi:hypothetical protein
VWERNGTEKTSTTSDDRDDDDDDGKRREKRKICVLLMLCCCFYFTLLVPCVHSSQSLYYSTRERVRKKQSEFLESSSSSLVDYELTELGYIILMVNVKCVQFGIDKVQARSPIQQWNHENVECCNIMFVFIMKILYFLCKWWVHGAESIFFSLHHLHQHQHIIPYAWEMREKKQQTFFFLIWLIFIYHVLMRLCIYLFFLP